MGSIANALAEVRGRIADAARRAGREPQDVLLLAVSKTRSPAEITEAVAVGAGDLGENYVQELADKHEALAAQGLDLRWHMIGHLQRNKVKTLAPFCALIHAVDSERLAAEISARAGEHGRAQPVLLALNIAAEESKFGVSPAEVERLAQAVAALPNVELRGLMAMTPYAAETDVCRRYFAQVRELAARLAGNLPPQAMSELSMGMTQDFELAVEEGATIVRVGTAIFGPRRAG